MKAHVIAIGLAMSLAAGGAVAGTWHWAEAPTKEEAMRLATSQARAKAWRKASCFKPAAVVDSCRQVADGFRCRASSAADRRGCGDRPGWEMALRARPARSLASTAATPSYPRASFELPWTLPEPTSPYTGSLYGAGPSFTQSVTATPFPQP
ncbi:hypothetical protein [Caulobacter hibisci]|uniref:Uncharacterized protein n=1 Tax=Caulobacter hibisci TaxID=2035993 RepID=A0ABS0T1I9_9CAUL|nr:hypothetical protein [Caulobacter hibisci]MBI1685733.1 hypothetical protein [Caulobacter hibisci]